MDAAALEGFFAAQGEKPFRARQLLHWIHKRGEADFARMSDLAKGLRDKLGTQARIEPPLILDNVIPALRLMLDDNAYGLSRRRVTVSTSGVIPGMDRLRDECPVALAVSLHAPNDALRDRLVPVNRKYPLRELVAACNRYLEKAPRDFITFEYVMLEGVNDGDQQARELVALAKRVRCKFNLIPFNPFPGSEFSRTDADRIRRFAQV